MQAIIKDMARRKNTTAEILQSGSTRLFPVFLKPDDLHVLIVGAGNTGLERLTAILNIGPSAFITVVAVNISRAVQQLAQQNPKVLLLNRAFEQADLNEKQLVIVATRSQAASTYIRKEAKKNNLLVHVAGMPELCDFDLGSIMQKDNPETGITTSAKSAEIPRYINEVVSDEKAKQPDELTKVVVTKHAQLGNTDRPEQKKWPNIVKWCLFAFLFMIIGHAVLSHVPYRELSERLIKIPEMINGRAFLIMLVIGFLAQMSDGSLGMGYGTISTTFLLAYGVAPALVSSQVHSARVFSSGVSGYSHHRFGNINKKLFKALVVPGVTGAAIGAACAYFGQKYSMYVRVPLSVYTIYLGYFIIKKAFTKKNFKDKVKKAGWLASAGGFMDAFAGGGWGTLVTSTLMAKRKSPRYVIGSVCLAEFFVVLTSSITFFILLKNIPIMEIAGLIIGGLIAAPIAARLVGKLPMKTMFILVGSLVILASASTLWKAITHFL